MQGPNLVTRRKSSGLWSSGLWTVWLVMYPHKPVPLPAMSHHCVGAGATGVSEQGRPATMGMGE